LVYDGIMKKMVLMDAVLLLPAGAFWLGTLLYVTLGTDWLFETVVARLGINPLGNALLIFLVVAAPGIVIATNGIHYAVSKNKVDKIVLGVATILLALGFFAVVRKG
jgi:hypothetical protein